MNNMKNLTITNALVEQHIHGGFGIDFATCVTQDFIEFSRKIVKYGVCGFFPTLATDTVENLNRQIDRIKEAQALQDKNCAKILGVHLEACFLNPEKKGIHNEKLFLKPTIENYKSLEDKIIKIVTVALELDEGFELCNYLKSKGVRVSAGHCTGNDLSAVSQVTHLFNAMGEFSHKNPSTVVSALSNDAVACELIADFKHVQKDVLKITFGVKCLNKIILISDALPIAHSSFDSMEFCDKTVFLKEGKAVDANGTMAGSTAFVSEIIKGLVSEGFLDLKTAVSMASTNTGCPACLDSQVYWDSSLNICAVNLNGNLITV